MKNYTLDSPFKMGEKHPEYGQSYWSSVLEQDTPVMFNLMSGDVQDGSVISAETVELKTSAKGKDYHRLKKVKIEGGPPVQAPQNAPASDLTEKLDAIAGDVKLLLSFVRQLQKDQEKDTVADFDIGDEPINLDSIPF